MKRKVLLLLVIILIGSISTEIALGQTINPRPVARLGKGEVKQATFSPDGELLAVATSIGVWLYDASNLTELGFLEDSHPITSIAFSPDGKLLVSASQGGPSLRLWDMKSKKQVAVFEKQYWWGSTAIAFSPDGRLIATGIGDVVLLWDVILKKQIEELKTPGSRPHGSPRPYYPVSSVAFSPDGNLLAWGSTNNTIVLWDIKTKKRVGVLKETFPEETLSPFFIAGVNIAFSPDGNLLASGHSNGSIILWEVPLQKKVGAIGEGRFDRISSLAFSPNGRWLTIGGNQGINCYDLVSQEIIDLSKDKEKYRIGSLLSLSFSPDGKMLVSVGTRNSVDLWDVVSQKKVGVLGEYGFVFEIEPIAFSPNSEVITLGDPHISWKVDSLIDGTWKENGSPYDWWPTDFHPSVAFSPDGNLLASVEGEGIKLWDVSLQEELAEFKGSAGRIYSVVFSPDSKLLAFGGSDCIIHLWDIALQKEIAVWKGHTSILRSIAFSPDSKLLASGGLEGGVSHCTIRLWDIALQKEIAVWKGPGWDMERDSIAFSPDGKVLAVGDANGIIHLWGIASQEKVAVLEAAEFGRDPLTYIGGHIYAIAFSPDGNLLVSGHSNGSIILWDWDAPLKKQVGTLKIHTEIVGHLAFSPNGKWLASGSFDGTVCLWDMKGLIREQTVQAKGKLSTTWANIKQTKLLQNYPNPFNPETWIPYQLAEDAEVRIKIFGSNGQLIRTLNIGRQLAGVYLSKEKAAHWDGLNEGGEAIASGVYFYTFHANDFIATKKMIIVK